ncbi:hypothetical protein [Vibrio sp.]|uniref:hypothetical protein n=1 Tax=Vibrio sp. TaxID=678 RepID=UPI003AA82289
MNPALMTDVVMIMMFLMVIVDVIDKRVPASLIDIVIGRLLTLVVQGCTNCCCDLSCYCNRFSECEKVENASLILKEGTLIEGIF